MRSIILASGSPYRRELLKKLNIPFESISADIDESSLRNESAMSLVERLSKEKADAVNQLIKEKYSKRIVIGSDQVAALGKEILTKPGTHSKAIEQLSKCSNQTVRFYTGLYLVNEQGQTQYSVESFDVAFRNLSKQQIENYVTQEQPLDCAGSFKVEGLGITLFRSLQGQDPNTLVGLPLIRLCDFLENWQAFPLDHQVS